MLGIDPIPVDRPHRQDPLIRRWIRHPIHRLIPRRSHQSHLLGKGIRHGFLHDPTIPGRSQTHVNHLCALIHRRINGLRQGKAVAGSFSIQNREPQNLCAWGRTSCSPDQGHHGCSVSLVTSKACSCRIQARIQQRQHHSLSPAG